MIHIDTHIACWLHDGVLHRLSSAARELIETSPLAISPMVELELQYLHEIGRLKINAHDILEVLRRELGLSLSTAPFASVVAHAVDLNWTRDPFDRLIVAQAAADHAPLVTCDENIRRNYSGAIW